MTKLSVVEPPRPTELRSLANDWLSSLRAGAKSVRTLESYRWPVYRLFLPFCDEQGYRAPRPARPAGPGPLQRVPARQAARGRPPAEQRVDRDLRAVRARVPGLGQEAGGGRGRSAAGPDPGQEGRSHAGAERDRGAGERRGDGARQAHRPGPGEHRPEARRAAGAPTGRLDPERPWVVPAGPWEGQQGTARPLRPPAVARRLRRYADRGRHPDAASDRIFLTIRRSRRTGRYEPLERRTVEQMMKGLAEKAGIDATRAYPHALRHSFATWALRSGMNALMLQEA